MIAVTTGAPTATTGQTKAPGETTTPASPPTPRKSCYKVVFAPAWN